MLVVITTIIAAVALLILGLVWFLRRIWFYRDPVRIPPGDEDAILAPADGKLIYARRFENGEVYSEKLGQRIPISEISKMDFAMGESGWMIGIYMTPLDVHFNYAPISGKVCRIVHTQAALNLPMLDMWEYIRLTYLRKAVDLFGRKYHLLNERNTLFIEGDRLKLAVVEIADKFINKIRCFVTEGDVVKAGQKLSFIERGSQVDLVIPVTPGAEADIEIVARVGEQVYGGKTIIARISPAAGSAAKPA
ncbi:MAG: phosphatidylserine decarboxylase [Firmicutes bacterium]|nr:phosphatidylserine decarboxylase [Bacillota bacterium]